MRPKKPEATGEGDLFRARLDQIINLKQELVQLGGKIELRAKAEDVVSSFLPDESPLGLGQSSQC